MTEQIRIMQYHFTVVVDVVVDSNNRIVGVDRPYIEDILPPHSDTQVFDVGDGEWVANSPADFDADNKWVGSGWHKASELVMRLLAADPVPVCGDCEKPIEGRVARVVGGKPWCGDCAEADYLHRTKQ